MNNDTWTLRAMNNDKWTLRAMNNDKWPLRAMNSDTWTLRAMHNDKWTLRAMKMTQWIKEWMKQWMNESVKQWINEAMKEWSNESMKQWMNESRKQWSSESMKQYEIVLPMKSTSFSDQLRDDPAESAEQGIYEKCEYWTMIHEYKMPCRAPRSTSCWSGWCPAWRWGWASSQRCRIVPCTAWARWRNHAPAVLDNII